MSETKRKNEGQLEMDQPDPKEGIDPSKEGFATKKFNELKPRNTSPPVSKVEKKSSETPVNTVVSKAVASDSPALPETITEDLNLVAETDERTKLQIFKLASFLHKNNLLPQSIKTVEEAIVSIQTSMALGFRTYGEVSLALNNMYIINNSVQLYGDLPLALVRSSGLIEQIDEFFLNEKHERISLHNKNLNDRAMIAVCKLKRKGEEWREFFVTEDDLITSGMTRSPDGAFKYEKAKGYFSVTWRKFWKIHWKRRTRAIGLKDVFGDVLKGRKIFEYDYHPGKDDNSVDEQKIKKVEAITKG